MAQVLAFDPVKGKSYLFSSRKQAEATGNGLLFPTGPNDIADNPVLYRTQMLLEFYNKNSGKDPIKRFETREKAAARIWPMLKDKATEITEIGGDVPGHGEVTTKVVKKAKAEKSPREGTSSYAGKKLFAKTTENERRFGSKGYDSYQIILDTPGIAYEDFIGKGGRLKDLAWDDKKFGRIRTE